MKSERISRIFQVLRMVAANPEPTSLKDISTALELHPSMVSRIVADLAEEGLIAKYAYRSVIPAPELVLLGTKALKNHPLSSIARQVLLPFLNEKELSADFSVLSASGFCSFFQFRKGGWIAEAAGRADSAAVILASENVSDAEIPGRLKGAFPGAAEMLPRLMKRIAEARESRFLVNHHNGRFFQLTLPVRCGGFLCGFSVASGKTQETEALLSECFRLGGKIRSLYENLLNTDAQS